MKEITARDLKESLTLLLAQTVGDEEGGTKDIWKKGPRLWASLWPLINTDGFHNEDEGGPMAAHHGYLKNLPAARYRLFMRAGIHLPQKVAFLWNLRQKTKRLLVVSTPVLIQKNRFLRMTVVETPHA